MTAIPYLQRQLRELTLNPPAGFRIEQGDSIYNWIVWFSGPNNTPYSGGQYKAMLTFPSDFPMEPPKFRIISEFWHPNVYSNGKVCISILDPPRADELSVDGAISMRWTPVQTVRSVLISVISLLSDPDPKDAGAPANVEALVQYRNNREEFDHKCSELARKSLQELPENFVAPTMEEKVEMPVNQPFMSAYSFSGNTTTTTIATTVVKDNVSGSDSYSQHNKYKLNSNNTNHNSGAKYDDNICQNYEDDVSTNDYNNELNEDEYDNDDDDDDGDGSTREKSQHKRQRTSKNKMGGIAPRSSAHRYTDELEQFRGLGFATTMTDEQLLDILDECRGDLASLIERVTESID